MFQSRRFESARAFAKRYGGRAVSDYGELLDSCDGVVLATPPALHTGQILQALERGKPVLAEKPLCVAADELERIIVAAESATPAAFVMVGENYYYKPSLWLVRLLLLEGRLGRVRSITAAKLTKKRSTAWRRDLGGLMEGGIHLVAQLADLVDATLIPGTDAELLAPTEIRASFPTKQSGVPERNARLDLTYDNGLRASLHYAWDVPARAKGLFQHTTVQGDAGAITLENSGLYVAWRKGRRRRLFGPRVSDLMGYQAMMDDFVRSIGTERRPYSNLDRGVRDLRIVFDAYAQMESQSDRE